MFLISFLFILLHLLLLLKCGFHAYLPTYLPSQEARNLDKTHVFCTLPPIKQVEAKIKNVLHLYKEGDEHRPLFTLKVQVPIGTYLPFTTADKLASSRWLCRMQTPETKSDICLRKGVLDFPQKDHTPPVRQPRCYFYRRILLLGRRNALGTFLMGWRMPWAVEKRLVCGGVTSKFCLLRVCGFCLFFRLSRSLLGLLFCVYCCLALGSALSFTRWVSGLERVVGSYGGPLVSFQAGSMRYLCKSSE